MSFSCHFQILHAISEIWAFTRRKPLGRQVSCVRTRDLTVIISIIWKTDIVCSCYCIDEDPSERRRRNVEAKTHNFSRPKMRGGCGSLLYSWDIVAVEGLRLLLGIWILHESFEWGSLEMSKFWQLNGYLEKRQKMRGGCRLLLYSWDIEIVERLRLHLLLFESFLELLILHLICRKFIKTRNRFYEAGLLFIDFD